jgi:hypothetical protein
MKPPMPARLHRAYLALHLAGWAAFVAFAAVSGSAPVRRLGLDGDSAAWLLFMRPSSRSSSRPCPR